MLVAAAAFCVSGLTTDPPVGVEAIPVMMIIIEAKV